MTIWSDMLDSIYDSDVACDALLTAGSVEALEVRAINKVAGIEVRTGADASLATIEPAAFLRMSTLDEAGLTLNDVSSGSLVINGKDWLIVGQVLKPNPDGELKGEVGLILSDANVG